MPRLSRTPQRAQRAATIAAFAAASFGEDEDEDQPQQQPEAGETQDDESSTPSI